MLLSKAKLVIVVGVLLSVAACRGRNASPVQELLGNKRAAVFVFLATDCPLSQSYTLTLNQLDTQFHSDDVGFYAVFSGSRVTSAAVDDFVRAYKINFPSVRDSDLKLAHFFGATKTPEVFSVDPKGNVFYKGAIDNWAPELGQHRTVITEHYLSDALNNFLAHRTVQVQQTNAVGCFIED
jgi:hypothetical protein